MRLQVKFEWLEQDGFVGLDHDFDNADKDSQEHVISCLSEAITYADDKNDMAAILERFEPVADAYDSDLLAWYNGLSVSVSNYIHEQQGYGGLIGGEIPLGNLADVQVQYYHDLARDLLAAIDELEFEYSIFINVPSNNIVVDNADDAEYIIQELYEKFCENASDDLITDSALFDRTFSYEAIDAMKPDEVITFANGDTFFNIMCAKA